MEHYDWNDGWLFAPTFDPAIVRPECTGVELEPVRLPHTVKTLPYNYCNENEYQRVSGYRREFFAPKEWQGRTVLLTFGAVAHDATVFCNGRRVFHHGCGYTAFTVDLTESLLLGQKNVVAVRCDSREDLNIPPFGGQIDFLTYGGIYRAVSLDVKEPAYLRDIFIEAQAEGDFRIYSSTVGETIGCTLQAEIRSPAGSRALYSGELSLPIVGTLNGVHPWSVEHPFLYTLTVRLIRPGTSGLPDRVLDEKSTRFGFRTIQFVAGGFYLNGQRVELRGLNRHQSYAYQGYAMPDSIQQLDAQLLKKQLGCNAVRTSHYPQSPAFLDACDELGLLVFVEMPGWQHIGDEAWQIFCTQHTDLIGWSVFLHKNGHIMYFSGSCLKQKIHNITEHFTAAVINVTFQFPDHIFGLLFLRFNEHGPQNTWPLILPLSGTKTDFSDYKRFRKGLGSSHRRYNRCPCRRNIFAFFSCQMKVQAMSRRNICHCRHRHRQNSMLAANGSATLTDFRHNDFLDPQIIKAYSHRYNIYNRIHCPNFMKMDFF